MQPRFNLEFLHVMQKYCNAPVFKMAETDKNAVETTVTVDILSDDFLLEDTSNTVQMTNEEQEQLNKIFETIENGQIDQNPNKNTKFELEQKKLRFSEVSKEDLDKLENENYATTTHWQTTWAVKALKGNIFLISFKYLSKIKK